MDSISQALWGAVTAEAVAPEKEKINLKVPPWLIGLVGGTLPDLDAFFKSATDPLFSTLMHRHFTHSILFIPIGALLTWLLFFYFFRKDRAHYFTYYKISVLAYGTHWILDVMTSYGTQILWPLTDKRFSTDWLSIIDPVLTLPWLLVFVAILIKPHLRRKLSRGIVVYTFIYMAFCGYQHARAKAELQEYAYDQGHTVEAIRLLPTLGNSFWFRGIYLHKGEIWAHGVFVRPFDNVRIKLGDRVKHVKLEQFKDLKEEAQKQLRIWNWFTQDWMYLSDDKPLHFGDARYSTKTTAFSSLWVFSLDPENVLNSRKIQNDFGRSTEERNPLEGFQYIFNPKRLEQDPNLIECQ